ncbi:head morphogenesis protein [Phyllobacterium brassicacearum]|uniref:Head morphogenesis protein n=1 Tax=Phyllobacterium brassicacearum TaxID=314235 RepID=A0A2P7BQ59_9HYPH|nr:phage minor head protein [Phyllobacterium brassicacearum]PSH68618.1 head morphogenesis protein [Phyllobacterium brassicacearum]TDQ24168.1 phage Mu protein F like protein [Phyllobacterium brassicacearum]
MLKRLSAREKFEQLIADYEPLLRNAFLESIRDIKSNIQIKRIVERLERNDIAGAIEALYLDQSAFRPLDRAIAQAFEGGGVAAVTDMPTLRDPSGAKLVVRFDMRNYRAEAWLREHSAGLVNDIIADQRNGIRTFLTEGLEAGRGPRAVALDIAGRVNRATGAREGGIVGLTAAQTRYVATARSELMSNDPEQLKRYLTRNRRDKRFDATVRKAIKTGKPIPVATIDRMTTQQYANRLLLLRGETIARTETMGALNASQMEAYQQLIDSGAISETVVQRVWHTARDGRVRDSHQGMEGQTVGFRTPFQSPRGPLLQYPGDPSAPASEIVNCRCRMSIKTDFLADID